MSFPKLLNLNQDQEIEAVKLVCLLVFGFLATIGYWLRPTLFGFDSYAHLNLLLFGFYSTLLNQPIANSWISLFPHSVLFVQFFMVFAAILCIVAIFYIVKSFFGERLAWISSLVLFGLSPVMLFTLGEFENELFAYPFILWGLYFLLNKKIKWALICCCFSLLFWKWPFYFLFSQKFGASIIEMNLFSGILNLWFLIPFVVCIVFLVKKNKWLAGLGLFFVVCWLWNGKFVVFLLPFLGLSIAAITELLENKVKPLFFGLNGKNVLNYVVILAFFGVVGWNAAYLLSSPNSNDWFVVEMAIKESQDRNLPLYASLGYDYWVTYKLGVEKVAYQQLWEEKDLNKPSVWVTSIDSNCKLIVQRNEFAKLKRVYLC